MGTDSRCFSCYNYMTDCLGAPKVAAEKETLNCHRIDPPEVETPLGEQINGFWEE
jgi:hypothetical protein